jgi:hypothetical protein
MVSAQNPANLRIAARPPFGFGYQMAKAMGTLTLLSNGTPMLFMGLGTPNQQQDSSWLGLPSGAAYKEIFNSSWPVFQVEFEQEHTNGGYDARFTAADFEPAVCRACGAAAAIDGRAIFWRKRNATRAGALTELPTGNGENVRKFQICLARF